MSTAVMVACTGRKPPWHVRQLQVALTTFSSLSITIVSRRVLVTLNGHYQALHLLAMPPDSCYLDLSNTRKAKLFDLMPLPASGS